MYQEEKPVVVALSILFCMGLIFLLSITVPTATANYTLFREDFLSSTIGSKETSKIIADFLNEGIVDGLEEDDLLIGEKDPEIFSDELTQKLINFYIKSLFNNEIDENAINDLCDMVEKEAVAYFNQNGYFDEYYTQEEFDEALEEFRSDMKNELLSLSEKDAEDESFAATYQKLKPTVTSATLGLSIATLALALILIIMHHKKYRGVRKVGICSFLAGGANSFFIFMIYFALKTSLRSELSDSAASVAEEKANIAVADAICDCFLPLIYTSLIMFAAGLIIIVVTCIIGSNFKKKIRAEFYANGGGQYGQGMAYNQGMTYGQVPPQYNQGTTYGQVPPQYNQNADMYSQNSDTYTQNSYNLNGTEYNTNGDNNSQNTDYHL